MKKLFIIIILFPFLTISAQEFKWAIQPMYDDVLPFSEGLSCVKINGKWGYINKTGKIILNIPDTIEVFPFAEGMAHAKMNNKYGFIKRPITK